MGLVHAFSCLETRAAFPVSLLTDCQLHSETKRQLTTDIHVCENGHGVGILTTIAW
jgi:hypothetical protein